MKRLMITATATMSLALAGAGMNGAGMDGAAALTKADKLVRPLPPPCEPPAPYSATTPLPPSPDPCPAPPR